MIDIHSHILPMVDDGARSFEEAENMLSGLVQLGYSRVVATPHWAVGMPDVSISIIQNMRDLGNRCGLSISVARECRIHQNLLEHVLRQDSLRIDGGKVVLVELPWGPTPVYTISVIADLQRSGFRPVLVHPERHAALFDADSPLDRLIESGVAVQCNLASFVGEHGRSSHDRALTLLKEGKVSLVSSDMHSLSDLETIVAPALKLLADLVGAEVATILTSYNPRALLSDQILTDFRCSGIALNQVELRSDTMNVVSRIWRKLAESRRV